MSDVILQDVRKTYPGGFEAVKGVSFAVPDGGLCVLVGPSGCGKSTLLRMVAGLETVTSGEVKIGGRRVNDLEPMDRDIAMVFQNYALYPHMSVYDNMAYGLRNLRTPKSEIDARVREAARILELNDEMLKRRPRQLSGGQRQRVAMGRAIVRKPACFLFDEPLSNLDAKLRVQMRIEIRKLQRALATTSIYVTHDQLEAMTLADVLVVMNAGRMEQAGPPLELFERPASLFVAGFIGSPAMNLLGGVREGDDGLRLADGTIVRAPLLRHVDAATATLGLRPELTHFVSDVAKPGDLRLPFDVDLAEDLGTSRLVHGRVGGTPFTVVQAPGRPPPPAGRTEVAIDPAVLHLFDSTSGLRIEPAGGA